MWGYDTSRSANTLPKVLFLQGNLKHLLVAQQFPDHCPAAKFVVYSDTKGEGMVSRPVRRLRVRPRPPQPIQITGLRVDSLFGKYSYDYIPVNAGEDHKGRISVLYGDNGTGKTTILRLLYAVLSHESSKGLRTHVARTHFKSFVVYFSNGTSISVEKAVPIGDYIYKFNLSDGDFSIFVEANPDNSVSLTDSVARLEFELSKLKLDILFVDHNRYVQSTYTFLADLQTTASDNQLLLDAQRFVDEGDGSIRRRRRLKETDLQFPLPQVVSALESTFRSIAYRQGAVGDQGAAAVYLDIVKSITKDRRKSDEARPHEIADVITTLSNLKDYTQSFIRHGLLSEYPFDALTALYTGASKGKKGQIQAVLAPFLDSIQRRLVALDEVHRRITIFERELAQYLPKKQVSFHILDGLVISDNEGPLKLDSLSSGERQLVFLLCSAAISRDRRSLILIDEPELSLNYKWQRMIAGSLANISSGGETQYILASHSIEIITRYVDSAFELPS